MEYIRKVFYYETDQMGIVHHSNYIRWFEEARVEWLEQAEYPYGRMEQEGIISPVLGVECEYVSMVHFGETVIIDVEVEDFKSVKYSFRYVVKDAESGVIRCKGRTRHCFLTRDGKPLPIKKQFPKLWEKINSEVDE